MIGIITFSVYLFFGMFVDALFNLAGAIWHFGLIYFKQRRTISYNLATRLFILGVMAIVLVGYCISPTLVDGIIFIFLPAIVIVILRPKREAIALLIVYYTLFILINVLSLGTFTLDGHLIILVILVDATSLFFLYTYVNETRRLRYALIHTNRSLQEESQTDALTQVANRKAYDHYLQARLDDFDVHGTRFALCLFDVDHFKSLNDTYGHDRGDVVLHELAQLLKRTIREGDFIARYGGEEFALFFPRANAALAVELAERIRNKIEMTTLIRERRVTVSIGISIVREHDTAATIFKRADEALYTAKQSGRNRTEVG